MGPLYVNELTNLFKLLIYNNSGYEMPNVRLVSF